MLAAEGDQRPKRLVVLGEKAPPVNNASGVAGGDVIPLAAMKGTGRGVASLGAVPSNQLAVILFPTNHRIYVTLIALKCPHLTRLSQLSFISVFE